MLAPPSANLSHRRQRLLVVEDDADISLLIADMLEERGYDVVRTTDGNNLETMLRQDSIDLVILDLMLPGEDGLSLCRRLRARYGVPMLMLTAIGAEADRIIGLESGADDYMVKPFAPRELLARVRALLRRTGGHADPGQPAETVAYLFDGWELHLMRLSLTAPDGALVPLTSAEFSLLATLCTRAGQVVSRDVLLSRGQNMHQAAYDRSVDTLIGRLRRKLAAQTQTPPGAEAEPPATEIIRTVRNAGYMFVPPVTPRTRGAA
jgi:two-component system OmpR family response regulator